MGIFDSYEDEARKNRKKIIVEKVKGKINEEGISNLVPQSDWQRLIVEQNQAIIELLALTASGTLGGAMGGSIGLQNYYETLAKMGNLNIDE